MKINITPLYLSEEDCFLTWPSEPDLREDPKGAGGNSGIRRIRHGFMQFQTADASGRPGGLLSRAMT